MELRITMYLATDDGPHAPEGPGWYILATDGLTEIVPHVRLPASTMLKFGQVIDNFVKGKPKNPGIDRSQVDITVHQAVREANEEAQRAIQSQLDLLKARAAEFDNEEKS